MKTIDLNNYNYYEGVQSTSKIFDDIVHIEPLMPQKVDELSEEDAKKTNINFHLGLINRDTFLQKNAPIAIKSDTIEGLSKIIELIDYEYEIRTFIDKNSKVSNLLRDTPEEKNKNLLNVKKELDLLGISNSKTELLVYYFRTVLDNVQKEFYNENIKNVVDSAELVLMK